MNFEQIKKKYPKAWEKFENFAIVSPELEADSFGYSDDYVDDINRLSLITLSGYLFKFFDELPKPIIIERFTVPIDAYDPDEEIIFYFIKHNSHEYDFDTLQEAFTKAFEILEKTC